MICSAEVEDLMLNQNNENHELLMLHELKLCSDGQYSILCIVMELLMVITTFSTTDWQLDSDLGKLAAARTLLVYFLVPTT